MIGARTAILLFALACWDGWRLLAMRVSDGATAIPLLALGAGLAVAWMKLRRDQQIGVVPVALLLAAYAVATLVAPPMVRMGIAVAGLVFILHRAFGLARPPFAMFGLAMLTLPVLPTLDFYLSWPMRRISAILSAGLLRFNGFNVGVDGAAISWQGQLLLFDGPCSGVRMLWASLLLTSLLALIGRFRLVPYIVALVATAILATFANALRATSLFFLEGGFVPHLKGPVFHELVGVGAFALLGGFLLFVFRWHEERMRPCA
jgi:exosortase/archaeosortase family protein